MPLHKNTVVLPHWLRGRSPLFLFVSLAWPMTALASDDFLNLPLEDLLKIEISSASRKTPKLQQVAAATFVLSSEDFGHDGDNPLLIAVANRFSASVRTKNLVVRFGGDEFVVLMENVDDLAQAKRRSNKLLKAIIPPCQLADRDFFNPARSALS